MVTHNFSRGWSNAGAISKTVAISAGAEYNIDESIPASTTDQLVAFVLDVSQLKGIFMVSDYAVTVETNSGSTAANTFTLPANTPYMWVLGDAAMRDTAGAVVTTDITALYVTNGASSSALFQLRAVVDPTL